MAGEGAAGFVIEGRRYEFPDFDSFDLNEAELFSEISGFGVEDLYPDPDDPQANTAIAKLLVRPRTVRALATISYLRVHKDADKHAVIELVGGANYSGALLELFTEDSEDPTPASVMTPSESSPRSEDDSSASSGTDSTSTSDAPADQQPNTGTPESDTSSPDIPDPTSVS